jgi:hypothetical protein
MLCVTAFGVADRAAQDAPVTITALVIPDGHYSPVVLHEMDSDAVKSGLERWR